MRGDFTPRSGRLSRSLQEKFRRGIGLARVGDLEEALSEFEGILKTNPEAPSAHLFIGSILYRERRDEEATKHFHKVLEMEPESYQAMVGLGRVYLRQDKLKQALEQFRNALKVEPKSPVVYVGLGQFFAQEKNYEAAMQMFYKAVRLDPQLVPIRLLISQLYADIGKVTEAVAELKSALDINPRNQYKTLAYLRLGRIYLDQKNYLAAAEAFEAATKISPEVPPPAHMGLAEALINMDKLEEAADILREIPRLRQIEATRHKLWGDIYRRQGLLKEAENEYKAAQLLGAEKEDFASELEHLDALLDTHYSLVE